MKSFISLPVPGLTLKATHHSVSLYLLVYHDKDALTHTHQDVICFIELTVSMLSLGAISNFA